MQLIINIAKDFSPIPGARYPIEGDYSGQEFRQNILAPQLREAIESSCELLIDLDGTLGYGTSFLEEAFGGLIRTDKFNIDDINKHIRYVCNDDPSYIDEIQTYIAEANAKENC